MRLLAQRNRFPWRFSIFLLKKIYRNISPFSQISRRIWMSRLNLDRVR